MAKHGAKVLTGPFMLKINPHEDGMAVSIDPHLEKMELAELLVGVLDSILVDSYMPITILVPKDKTQQVKVVSASGVPSDVLEQFLRKLADGLKE